ncbi:MAG: acyltransferase family protein [Jatrophihabitans sp.]|nr:MAG: acyltransferase family protein [Jatrophihabitans sp.]
MTHSSDGIARVIRLPRAAGRPPAHRPPVTGDAEVVPLGGGAEAVPPVVSPAVSPAAAGPAPGWERRAAAVLAFLRRRVSGEYELDEFGYDPDLTDRVVVPALRPLYDRWFRVEVSGAEHLPRSGGALLVANHAGGLWPLDAAMTALAVRRHAGGRALRLLAPEIVFATPGAGTLARRAGAALACVPDAQRLLVRGELVGCWPEGSAGIGKRFRDRYRLRDFDRSAFTAALAAGVPIIPVSIVGSEEIHPVLADARPLARLLGLPYFPLTPTFPWFGPLGLVPLPSKWQIVFGTPVGSTVGPAAGSRPPAPPTGPAATVDPAVVFEVSDEVRERIQATLHRLLVQRRSVWR